MPLFFPPVRICLRISRWLWPVRERYEIAGNCSFFLCHFGDMTANFLGDSILVFWLSIPVSIEPHMNFQGEPSELSIATVMEGNASLFGWSFAST